MLYFVNPQTEPRLIKICKLLDVLKGKMCIFINGGLCGIIKVNFPFCRANIDIGENNLMLDEKKEVILEEFIKPRRFGSKFWMYLIVFSLFVLIILLFKTNIIDKSITADELKSSVEFFNISSQWIVKEKINENDFKGIILVPEITFRVRNIGKINLKYVFFLGVFRFLDTGKTMGEGYKLGIKKSLQPGGESDPIKLAAGFGYRASSKEAFKRNQRNWGNAYVEIFIKSRNSKLVFFKSYYISRKIEGMDIDVRINKVNFGG